MNKLVCQLGRHISSVSMLMIFIALYLFESTSWIDDYLPINGKPLVIGMLVLIIVLFEYSYKRFGLLELKVDTLSKTIAVNDLKRAVGHFHARVKSSNDGFIDSEYAKRELADLTDKRAKLGVNSYTQMMLDELNSMVVFKHPQQGR